VRWLPFCVALLGMAAGVALADDAPATPDSLRQLLNDKKYQEVVQKAAKALTVGGAAAQGQDRYDVLMIKGEAQIQLKQGAYAADTFDLAARTASKAADADAASALAELVRKSPGLKYVPAGHGTPIDIADPVNRKAALTALYADESAAQSPALRAAMEATTLGPITDAMKNMVLPRALEVAATGSDAHSAAALKLLATRARDIMAAAVKDRHDEVRRIYDAANSEATSGGVPGPPTPLKPGLSTRDRDTLKAIAHECDLIAATAKDMADTAAVDGLTAVVTDAQAVKEDAQRTLATEFTDPQGNPGSSTPNPMGR